MSMVQHYPSLSILPDKLPEVEGSPLSTRQLITDKLAPHFIMRRYELQPRATHQFDSEQGEREIYLLAGHLDVTGGKQFHTPLSPDDFLYVPPENTLLLTNTSDQPAIFLDILPKSAEVSINLPHP
ncbi:MAG: cupin domain-containing protein, partial [Candidatus Heimdallarchaeota archaeon]|nr:cupin domain-containing protein [Candidatus Heimdallarchaeota archaeon]